MSAIRGSIILVRLDSKRFPFKALKNLGGKPLIEWIIDSLNRNQGFKTILATTWRKIDDPLIDISKKKGISYIRGPLRDVAKRVLMCIEKFKLDYFARINGDSPFVSSELLLKGFRVIETKQADLVTNLLPRAFPYGVSVEILKSSVFCSNYKNFSPSHREHITSYFYEHADDFKIKPIKYGRGNDHDVRLVVDTPADLSRLRNIVSRLGKNHTYSVNDLVTAYRNVGGI